MILYAYVRMEGLTRTAPLVFRKLAKLGSSVGVVYASVEMYVSRQPVRMTNNSHSQTAPQGGSRVVDSFSLFSS